MATLQGLCMMGTPGDTLPMVSIGAAFALRHKGRVHLVVQPSQLALVADKLTSSPCFAPLATEKIEVQRDAYKIIFTPPVGGPPRVERSPKADDKARVEIDHRTWGADTGAQIHVWAPADEVCDEKNHQEWGDVKDFAFKKPSYGDFLSMWQVVLSHLDTLLPPSGVLRVTNCYDQEGNCKLIEAAIDYKHDLQVRIGSLGMLDVCTEKKFYAVSPLLCPRRFHLAPKFAKSVDLDAKALQGVISEPQAVFPSQALPPAIVSFLREEPTTVVTLSSTHLGTALQHLLRNTHCLFICSVEENSLEGHLHWPHPLNLDAVFAEASMVVHACGVGTAHKVVCSGKPSICVSLTKEQLSNAKRLEELGVATHYALQDLMADITTQDAFMKALSAPRDNQRLQLLQAQVLDESYGLSACVTRMTELLDPGHRTDQV
jgi:hypothetical protein